MTSPVSLNEAVPEIAVAVQSLRQWVEERDYAGYEPYDLLNSPWLRQVWRHSSLLSGSVIRLGREFGGAGARRALEVPVSKNPKALGVFLAGYCDLARCGSEARERAMYLVKELRRLSSPGECELCWGYDWNFVSRRGSRLPAFAANSIATVFCAEALMDTAEVLSAEDCAEMAGSAARFLSIRLNRSWDTPDELCLSYTPQDHTLIFNNSLLVGAFLARVGMAIGEPEYIALARRCMEFACARQNRDGSWAYGVNRMQRWVDGFHTGYNLCALALYRQRTGDRSFDSNIEAGYRFYRERCFSSDGIPMYFADRLYPIDIHACTQAILTFCTFASDDPEAIARAINVAHWTIKNMRSEEGCFYYQRHRFWTNRTPYMRWCQAWMFRALTALLRQIKEQGNEIVDRSR